VEALSVNEEVQRGDDVRALLAEVLFQDFRAKQCGCCCGKRGLDP
jgi:hypothetical protein